MGLIGLIVAAIGTGLAFAGLPVFGYWVGVVGALSGLIGVALHFVLNWRTIFGVTRQ